MERDKNDISRGKSAKNFNSHAHVERDLTGITSAMISKNFNSHAHVERDSPTDVASTKLKISTHTLTWSVTGVYIIYPLDRRISTHTLTWSVTHSGKF